MEFLVEMDGSGLQTANRQGYKLRRRMAKSEGKRDPSNKTGAVIAMSETKTRMGRWFVMFEKGCQDERQRSVDVEKQSERRTKTKRYAMTAFSSALWGAQAQVSHPLTQVYAYARLRKPDEEGKAGRPRRYPHLGRRHRSVKGSDKDGGR